MALSEEEVTRLAGELDAVASSFARVTSVVTPDLPATSHSVPLTNVLRQDVPGPTLELRFGVRIGRLQDGEKALDLRGRHGGKSLAAANAN